MDNPYQAPTVDAAATQEGGLRYCGFWRRFFASCIDSLLMGAVITLLGMAVYGMAYVDSDKKIHGTFDWLISYALPFAFYVGMWVRYGGTPGKIWLNVKIVDIETRQPPSVGQAIGRYFAYILSTLPLFLGFFWMLWDRRKQCWHDKLTGVVVVHRDGADSFR